MPHQVATSCSSEEIPLDGGRGPAGGAPASDGSPNAGSPYLGSPCNGNPADSAGARADDELMAAIKEGDQGAFAALYDRYAAVVYGLCLRVLHRDCEAEAVVSDVFLEIWRKPHGFNPHRGRCRTYLLTLARSRAIDRWRASATRTRKIQDASQEFIANAPQTQLSHEPLRLALASERQQAVRQAVDRLEPKQRDALMLAYFEGLTHREVAQRLNMPLGSVKTYIRNGLRSLRTSLSTLSESIEGEPTGREPIEGETVWGKTVEGETNG